MTNSTMLSFSSAEKKNLILDKWYKQLCYICSVTNIVVSLWYCLFFCNQKIALERKWYEPRSKPSHSELISLGRVTLKLCLSIRKDLQTGDMTRISDNVYFQRNLQYQRKFLTLLSTYFLSVCYTINTALSSHHIFFLCLTFNFKPAHLYFNDCLIQMYIPNVNA